MVTLRIADARARRGGRGCPPALANDNRGYQSLTPGQHDRVYYQRENHGVFVDTSPRLRGQHFLPVDVARDRFKDESNERRGRSHQIMRILERMAH